MNPLARCYACMVKSSPRCTHLSRSESEPIIVIPTIAPQAERRMRSNGEIVALAQSAWCHNFRIMPFSTFHMIDFVLGKAHLEWKDLLSTPDCLAQLSGEIDLGHDFYTKIHFNWLKSRAAGRCTAVSIQLADRLNMYGHEFEFFDMNGHRLARCKHTGLVIDSSSKEGPVLVPPGSEVTRGGPKGLTWGYNLSTDGEGICETSFLNSRSIRKFV